MNNEGHSEKPGSDGPAQSEQWGEWGPQGQTIPPTEARAGEPPPYRNADGGEHMERGYRPLPPSSYYQPYTPPTYPPYGYAPTTYVMPPAKPRRDGYLLALAITATSGGGYLVLQGFFGLLYLAILAVILSDIARRLPSGNSSIDNMTLAIGAIEFIVITLYLCGGGVVLYHGIRALIKKPSARFNLGQFWIWLLAFGGVIMAGLTLQAAHLGPIYPLLPISLAVLAALFPAMALTAFGANMLKSERLRLTWRRMGSAFVSGATISNYIALALEFLIFFLLLLVFVSGPISSFNSILPLIIISTIAPILDLFTRSLMVAVSIGRIKHEEEALHLGLASGTGMGFCQALVILLMLAATGTFTPSYNFWPEMAIISLNLVLMHGICNAFASVGWHRLVHTKEERLLSLVKYWMGPLLIQAIIYATWTTLLIAPLSQIALWRIIDFGQISIPFQMVLIFFETLGLLAAFLLVLNRIKRRTYINNEPSNLAYMQASIDQPVEQAQRQF